MTEQGSLQGAFYSQSARKETLAVLGVGVSSQTLNDTYYGLLCFVLHIGGAVCMGPQCEKLLLWPRFCHLHCLCASGELVSRKTYIAVARQILCIYVFQLDFCAIRSLVLL